MNISKRDALMWFEFFAQLPEYEQLSPRQQEIVYAVFSQIENAVERDAEILRARIANLKTLDGRTYYVGPDEQFPKGCVSCLTGTGLTAIRKTNRCNIQCPFCYNYGELDCQPPIGEGMWEIGGCKYREADIDLLLRASVRPTGVSYVYLEPFMEIEKYYGIIRRFRAAGVRQHMYTNGTLCTEENLRVLGDAGLDELRFNLGATNCADRVIENIKTAKKYIPNVGIETPMTAEFYDSFLSKKDRILGTWLDFMNCAELHLNPNNIENYMGMNMYITRHGYISPIDSHYLTLDLMRIASEEAWPIAVHDCCNMTKFARDINLRAHEGGWFGASGYACEFDETPYAAFLPVLEDPDFDFVAEEELPEGYRIGDITF